MKKLIIILSLFISVATYSQGVKISAMPTLTDPALIQGGYVPIVSNLINYKFQPNLFALSSTTITINGETHDLSEDRSWTVTTGVAWGGITGTLADQTDLINALNLKVDESTTITINGVTQDLSTNRSWTISTSGGGIQSIEGTNGTVVVNDSIVKLGTNPLIENTVINGAGSFYLRFTDTRMQEDLGASISAANDLTLGNDGNTFTITGNTQINAITTTNWQTGSVVRLIFTGTPTVKHNTAGGGSTAVILLSGATDFVAAANDVLTLVYDGQWHETSRKLSTVTSTSYTFENALTNSSGTVRLGGAMTGATTVSAMSNTNTITWTGAYSGAGQQFLITNTSTGTAFGATNNGGSAAATIQNSSNGVGLNVTSSSGIGLTGSTTTGTMAARFDANPSSTNTTQNVLTVRRLTSGTAANNIAAGFELDNEATDGSTYLAARFVAAFTNATAASRVSSLFVELTDNAVNANKVEFTGGGNVKLLTAGKGLALTSPDGTVYYGTISNAGVLSWSTSVP